MFAESAIQIHRIMDSIVSVIMGTMEIGINANDVFPLVENAQGLMQMNVRLVLI